jgi:signal transduction histidine kinase
MTKIIVIEDEFDIREEVISWLRFEGYETFGAENGRLGLDVIQRERPDLILCDISMPEMNGYEVLSEIRADPTLAQTAFVFITAAADLNSMRKGMNLGADDYLTKPFTLREVIRTVAARLEKRERIQEQVQHLNEMLHSEREQRLLKSRLIGMFSHDFRNPLTSILSSSGILQNYGEQLTPEKRAKHFNQIDGSVHRLMQMLDEMLMVAELENGQLEAHPQPLDLQKLIEKLVSDIRLIDADQHTLYLTCALPMFVQLDLKLIQHILTNLVSNAVKYTPAGREIHVQAMTELDEIVIMVQDQGIGIPASEIDKIFEPFFRAGNVHHLKGTGLGLALVASLVEISGGRITVTSEQDVGSCFEVRLPLVLA